MKYGSVHIIIALNCKLAADKRIIQILDMCKERIRDDPADIVAIKQVILYRDIGTVGIDQMAPDVIRYIIVLHKNSVVEL
ncbi:hypothetical protein D3C78_890550 [compost metagenome]